MCFMFFVKFRIRMRRFRFYFEGSYEDIMNCGIKLEGNEFYFGGVIIKV